MRRPLRDDRLDRRARRCACACACGGMSSGGFRVWRCRAPGLKIRCLVILNCLTKWLGYRRRIDWGMRSVELSFIPDEKHGYPPPATGWGGRLTVLEQTLWQGPSHNNSRAEFGLRWLVHLSSQPGVAIPLGAQYLAPSPFGQEGWRFRPLKIRYATSLHYTIVIQRQLPAWPI